MDIKRFKEELPNLLLTPSGDNAFASLRIITHGMSGVRTAKIINFACRCMDEDETYIEIGTFSGYTLISAGYQLNSACLGIDDFSMEDIVSRESQKSARDIIHGKLMHNMSEYGTPNTHFIEADFRNVQLDDKAKGKLSVLFIDGKHTYEEVKETVEKFSPYFAKDAIIILDDVQFRNISKYVHELCLTDSYEMLAYLISTPHNHDISFHMNKSLNEFIANGICVLSRRSNA